MTGTSKATALNLNSGAAIDMRADNNAYSTLTAENMQGSGGIIKQDIDVRTMESDKVFVTGDFNGTQALDIYQKDDYVPAGDSTEGTGLVLASVNGNGTFTALKTVKELCSTPIMIWRIRPAKQPGLPLTGI